MLRIAALLILASGTVSAQTVFKCTNADGSKTYSNSPCPESATETRVDVEKDPPAHVAMGISKDASQTERLSSAVAIVDSIAIDGRDCSWALKVTRKLSECKPFADKVGSARFKAARSTIGELLKDEEFAKQHSVQLQAVVRDLNEILENMKLLTERV